MRYLTGKNKRREVALQGALLDRMAARFQMSVARQIQNAMRAGLKQFEQDGSTVSVDAAIDPYEIRMTAAISTEARNIMQTFGERILGNEKRLRKDIGDDPFEQVMQNYIRTYGLQHAKQITTTTKDQLRTLIQDALNEGIGTEQIARNIRKKIPSMAQYRAATIARTETHTAANFGSQAAAEATGLNLMKEWAAAEDDRTREDHAAADGQVVPMNGTFTVGGVELMFPGDPSGPPEQVINCFSGDTLVSFQSCKKAIKSLYTGEMLTIKTAAGYTFTGTPNHPVMTQAGLIPIGEVNHSTDLFCCPMDKNIVGTLNVKNIPAKFEEVFNSALVMGVVMRVGNSSVNLYNRIPENEVSVVNVDGLLLNTLLAQSLERKQKLSFKLSNLCQRFFFANGLLDRVSVMKFFGFVPNSFMRFTNLLSLLLVRHLRPLQQFRLALVSDVNIVSQKDVPNNSSASVKPNRNFVFAKTAVVKVNNFLRQQFDLSSRRHNVIGSTKGISKAHANIQTIGDFLDAKTSFVHTDKIVSIDRKFVHNFPVYTLETKEGLYNAGGIVAGNCRCVQLFIET